MRASPNFCVRFHSDQPITAFLKEMERSSERGCLDATEKLQTILLWSGEIALQGSEKDIHLSTLGEEKLFISFYENAAIYYVEKSNIIYPIGVIFDSDPMGASFVQGSRYQRPCFFQVVNQSWLSRYNGPRTMSLRDAELSRSCIKVVLTVPSRGRSSVVSCEPFVMSSQWNVTGENIGECNRYAYRHTVESPLFSIRYDRLQDMICAISEAPSRRSEASVTLAVLHDPHARRTETNFPRSFIRTLQSIL